jgi:hypothetical protein
MKVSIIIKDQYVIVDGKPLQCDLSKLNTEGIHAIQWDGIKGTIETINGTINNLVDLSILDSFVSIYNDEIAKIASEKSPVLDIAQTRTKKIQELAAYRYKIETSGITIDGMIVDTDRQSQAMLTGATLYSSLIPEAVIDWKGVNGWVQIDKQSIEKVALIVGAYVQACFTCEKKHSEAINKLETKEEIENYDFTINWPSNK